MAINPAILQQQAKAQAPGVTIGAQQTPANVAKGRKQSKGTSKTPAQTIYPQLPTQGDTQA